MTEFPVSTTTRKKGVFFIEVVMSNPNGDPANAGGPRTLNDNRGLITNACIKRVIRDYAESVCGKKLYMERDAELGEQQAAFDKDAEKMKAALWDLRPFGGTLTQADARVRGAVQFSDAISLDAVESITIEGTRVSGHDRTRTKKKKNPDDDSEEEEFRGANMFSYDVIQYGLYRGEFTLDPAQAARVGLTEDDMRVLYAGLTEGFEYTRSAHRTGVNIRALYVFDSPTARGTEPSHVTAARVHAERLVDTPEKFSDYAITVDDDLPSGMTLTRWVDGKIS